MQSTRSASIRVQRMSPSLDWLEDILPLARTKPTMPRGARWWMKYCSQAKLALPLGGTGQMPNVEFRISNVSVKRNKSIFAELNFNSNFILHKVRLVVAINWFLFSACNKNFFCSLVDISALFPVNSRLRVMQ